MRKRYNPLKAIMGYTRRKVQNSALVFVQGIPQTIIYDRTSKRLSHKIDRQHFEEVTHSRYKWNVTIAVLGLNQDGKEAVVWAEVSVDTPVLQTDLADVLTENHKALLDEPECAELDNTRFAWIAIPSDNVLPDEEMFWVFERLRGFKESIF